MGNARPFQFIKKYGLCLHTVDIKLALYYEDKAQDFPGISPGFELNYIEREIVLLPNSSVTNIT